MKNNILKLGKKDLKKILDLCQCFDDIVKIVSSGSVMDYPFPEEEALRRYDLIVERLNIYQQELN